MTLILTRQDKREDGIFSELTDEKGKLSLVAAEHSYNKFPKLPDGSYVCRRGVHRLHNNIPFETFEISSVPGHTNILIHIGNYPQVDSDGCILVGISINNNMITHSAIAFSKFMGLLEGLQTFNLIVTSR